MLATNGCLDLCLLAPDFYYLVSTIMNISFCLGHPQEKGSKAKLCLQAEDENELLQVESAAMNEGAVLCLLLSSVSSQTSLD